MFVAAVLALKLSHRLHAVAAVLNRERGIAAPALVDREPPACRGVRVAGGEVHRHVAREADALLDVGRGSLREQLRLDGPDHQAGARRTLGLPEDARVVTVMPGSRMGELKYLAAPFVAAVKLLAARDMVREFAAWAVSLPKSSLPRLATT